jgi:ribose transport system substrate-binding protein
MAGSAVAKDLKSVGLTMGSLSNPYFIALVEGATQKAREINPDAKVTSVSSEYDLGKQSNQIDNFIASGVDVILVAAADPHAIAAAVQRARAAGIVVIAVDVEADGADATIETDNAKAGEISCDYLAKKMDGAGKVAIQWAGPASSSVARVEGCKKSLAAYPKISVIDDIHDTKCQRDLGMDVMLEQLQRYPDIKGVFPICEPAAIGVNLAAKQMHRDDIVITSVDGSPDATEALKSKTLIQGTASQSPREQGRLGVETGYNLMNGKAPQEKVRMLAPQLITRDNVDQYKGW